jgi:hypothetical protein
MSTYATSSATFWASATNRLHFYVTDLKLATARFGHTTAVQVWAKRGRGADRSATVRLTARSESDPVKAATGTCHVR